MHIYRVSGGTNLENFFAWGHRGFNVCTGLPKKTLDTAIMSNTLIMIKTGKYDLI